MVSAYPIKFKLSNPSTNRETAIYMESYLRNCQMDGNFPSDIIVTSFCPPISQNFQHFGNWQTKW